MDLNVAISISIAFEPDATSGFLSSAEMETFREAQRIVRVCAENEMKKHSSGHRSSITFNKTGFPTRVP